MQKSYRYTVAQHSEFAAPTSAEEKSGTPTRLAWLLTKGKSKKDVVVGRHKNEIRNISELPEWYSLEKYADSSRLGFVGWHEQLKIRQTIISLLDQLNKINAPTDLFQDLRDYIIDYLGRIRNDPLAERGSDPIFGTTVGTCDGYSPGVRLISILEFYMVERSIEKSKRDHIRTWMAEIEKKTKKSAGEEPQLVVEDWYSSTVDELSNSDVLEYTIQVNPLIPDKVLIDEFKELLKIIRQRHADSCNSQKLDFNAWIKFGVLPFLDLWMWQCLEDKSIPNRVMADAIFPPGDGGEEAVRKTTRKLAFALIENSHLETLAIKAMREKAERNVS